ncbi:hypothetical protein FKM82_029247 [Ascaphus truei]
MSCKVVCVCVTILPSCAQSLCLKHTTFRHKGFLLNVSSPSRYCHKHYDHNKPGNRDVYLSLIRMYLSPPDVHCLGPIKIKVEEPKANLGAALAVLEQHHGKLNTTKVTDRLPPTWGTRSDGGDTGRCRERRGLIGRIGDADSVTAVLTLALQY